MRPGKKFTLGFLPTLLCLTAMLVAACGGTTPTPPTGSSGPTKAAANQQIFVYPLGGITDIKTFDPGLSTDADSIIAEDMVFTGLVQLDDKLQVQDQLAASHQVMPDGLTWKFTLRPNLMFSDGTPLTSADVAYSINRALTPALKSIVSPAYLNLVKDSDKMLAGKLKTLIGDSLLTPDPQTIEIVTNKKAAYFLDALVYSDSYVVEKSLVEKYGTDTSEAWTDHLTEGGGAGPFKVAEYTHGQRIVFVPNPNYYGPKPQIAKLVMPFVKTADTVFKEYQVGQVDIAAVPTSELATAKALPNNQYSLVPQLWISYIAMNYLSPPFDNIKVRQAMDLAINKDLIAHNIYHDTVIASNHIVPNGMPGYTANLTNPEGTKSTSGDTAMAKSLFTAGLAEDHLTLATLPPIVFTVSTGGAADARNEVATIQQMWQNTLGITVKIVDEDFNKLLTDIPATTNNKSLQMWYIGWIADYPDPQDWTTLQFDKGAQNNNDNYGQNSTSDAAQQVAVQQALEAADVMPPGAARLQAYETAEQQLVNDVAWLPTYQVAVSQVLKPCVAGLVFNPQLLTPPNDWGSVYISTATPCANTSGL